MKKSRRRPPLPRRAAPSGVLRGLLSFLDAAGQQKSLDALTGEALAAIAPQFRYEIAGLHLLDEAGATLLLRAYYGAPPELLSRTRRLRVGDGIAGRAAASRKPVLARIGRSPLLPVGIAALMARFGINHQLSLPLLAHGRVLGTLNLLGRRRPPPGRRELADLQAFAHAIALALELRRQLDRTESAAQQATSVIVHSGDMIAELAPDSAILEINPAGRQLLGGDEFEGRPLLDFIDRRDHEALRAALGSGAAAILQLRRNRPGAPAWLELSLAEPAPLSGRAGAAVIATGRDITERKLVELELGQRNQELFALNKIAAIAASPSAFKERLAELLDRCLRIAGCDSGALYRLSARGDELVSIISAGFGPAALACPELKRVPAGEGSLGKLAVGDELLVFSRPGDLEPPAAAAALRADGVTCGIAIALRSGERNHGVLALTNRAPRAFNTYELSLITTLAHQLGAAFETQALLAETSGRLSELQLLNALGKTLAGTLELEPLLGATVAHLRRLMEMDGCFIWLREGERLRIAAASEGHEPLVGFAVGLGERNIAAEAARERRVIETRFPSERRRVQRSLLEKSGMHAALAVPLLVRGEAIGTLVFGRRALDARFTADEQRRIETVGQPVAIALDNARLFDADRRQRLALQALSTEVLRAQEEERRRLSRELHDGVAQSVSALKLSLSALRRRAAALDPALGAEVEALVANVGDSAAEVRRLSADLRPPILDELGLVPTLRAHTESVMRRSRLKIDFRAGEIPPLPQGYDINLYRIAQEGLNNILKHAKARKAVLSLESDAEAVQLELRDDGAGFDPARVRTTDRGGLGLVGMRERAALFGGSFEIHSVPGDGSTLTVRLPLPSDA